MLIYKKNSKSNHAKIWQIIGNYLSYFPKYIFFLKINQNKQNTHFPQTQINIVDILFPDQLV